MNYSKNKKYSFSGVFTYILGLVIIMGMGSLSYNLYKRNVGAQSMQECSEGTRHEVQVADPIRQILPINEHAVMIITATENGSANTIIYNHCQNKIVRQFNINVPEAIVTE